MSKKQKIGLALSGGSVLGAAHIGVIRAIEELEIEISYVAGTSIGALVAASYAFGKDWKEMKKFADELDWIEVSKISLSNYGLLSNEKMGDKLKNSIGDVKFEDSKIPLAVVAVNASNGKKKIIKEGKIAEAVMASSAIPGVFIPVEIDGELYVDGGVMENVPLTALEELGAKYDIAVDLNAAHKYQKPDNVIDLVLNTFDMMLGNATQLQTKEADLLITPDLSEFDYIETDQVDELVEAGYKEAMEVLKKEFR